MSTSARKFYNRKKSSVRKTSARKPVSSADDFGAGTELARQGVGALYDALASADTMLPGWAFDDWKRLLSQAMGHDLDRPSTTLAELAAAYDIDCRGDSETGPARTAFALHTYFSLLVKLILCRALGLLTTERGCSSRKGSSHEQLPANLLELAETLDDDALLMRMRELDNSQLCRVLRINRPCDDGEADWDPFGWYTDAWSGPLAAWLRRAAEIIGRYDPPELCNCGQEQAGGVDLLGDLYQSLLPKKVRHALGEYYTPSWLVAHILDGLGYRGKLDSRLLDPSCGSGNFLLAAIRRIRRQHESIKSELTPKDLAEIITNSVVGFDLNPTAVLAARANYLLAIGDLIAGSNQPASLPEIPVHLRDTILDDAPVEPFDFVAGNPPWIVWDNLSDDYREKTKPLWQRYGLFTLSGTAARHGGGKKDLSMLMTYVAADRHLVDGGRLGFVVTQTVFQTKGAGDGFRRFRLGEDGPHLGVLRADDMVRIRPFPGAANWTGTLFLQKSGETTYPVKYERWRLRPGARMPEAHVPDDGLWRERFECERLAARPIDDERPGSPWFVQPAELHTDLRGLIGPSDYTAHLGANTGGANAVYWLRLLERDGDDVRVRNMSETGVRDRRFETVEACVEPDLLYPLVRWGDVRRFSAVPAAHILLAQDVETRRGYDEEWLQDRCPDTYAYLSRFRAQLESRAAYRRYQSEAAFYSMYNVGRYTVAPIKVVWRRMDKRINAAVLESVEDELLGTRPVVPQETCAIVAVETIDEAHYLAAVLNSSRSDIIASGHSVSGGKGFGTPSMLEYLGIKRFDAQDERHIELARLGRLAQEQVAGGGDTSGIEKEINTVSFQDWKNSPAI